MVQQLKEGRVTMQTQSVKSFFLEVIGMLSKHFNLCMLLSPIVFIFQSNHHCELLCKRLLLQLGHEHVPF